MLALRLALLALALALAPGARGHSHAYYNGGKGIGLTADFLHKHGATSEHEYLERFKGKSDQEGAEGNPSDARQPLNTCEVCFITATHIVRELEKTAKASLCVVCVVMCVFVC